MAFNFTELNDNVRKFMLEEFESDLATNQLYKSSRFTEQGKEEYPAILKEALMSGTVESLVSALHDKGLFNAKEQSTGKNIGKYVKDVPDTAHITFAEGQFNMFYMRGICLSAIENSKRVEIYRAKEVDAPRPESEEKVRSRTPLDPTVELELLRKVGRGNFDVELAVGRPNSGLSLKTIS